MSLSLEELYCIAVTEDDVDVARSHTQHNRTRHKASTILVKQQTDRVSFLYKRMACYFPVAEVSSASSSGHTLSSTQRVAMVVHSFNGCCDASSIVSVGQATSEKARFISTGCCDVVSTAEEFVVEICWLAACSKTVQKRAC